MLLPLWPGFLTFLIRHLVVYLFVPKLPLIHPPSSPLTLAWFARGFHWPCRLKMSVFLPRVPPTMPPTVIWKPLRPTRTSFVKATWVSTCSPVCARPGVLCRHKARKESCRLSKSSRTPKKLAFGGGKIKHMDFQTLHSFAWPASSSQSRSPSLGRHKW